MKLSELKKLFPEYKVTDYVAHSNIDYDELSHEVVISFDFNEFNDNSPPKYREPEDLPEYNDDTEIDFFEFSYENHVLVNVNIKYDYPNEKYIATHRKFSPDVDYRSSFNCENAEAACDDDFTDTDKTVEYTLYLRESDKYEAELDKNNIDFVTYFRELAEQQKHAIDVFTELKEDFERIKKKIKIRMI